MIKLIRLQQYQECFYSVSKGKHELIAYTYWQIQLIIVWKEGKKILWDIGIWESKLRNKNSRFLVLWWCEYL